MGPAVDDGIEPEATAGDVRGMMTQVLMLDIDVPGPGETSGGLADELTLGGRRVRQFAAVDPLRVCVAGGRGDTHQQAGSQRKRDRKRGSFHVPSHPRDLIERSAREREPRREVTPEPR